MGLYDRDYVRDGNYRGDDGFPKPSQWSVVTWLIVINAAVLLIQMLYLSEERIGTVTRAEVFAGHIYLLLTYQFVHADLWHLGLNMLMLHFMGRPLLSRIGPKQFLGLYLGAGVFGGLVQILYSPHPILGASAAVFGVLYGMISLTPWQEVYLLLFFV
ncbi:MAG: rhomboid family intramembrane serine protease, partial [Verrucomicrobiae bacterium]|nr:rhomboid family intramembrane serine protease [Verrucomicrobiae bacterium]